MYELLVGSVPFTGDTVLDIYESILSGNLELPSTFSSAVTDIIRKLLNNVPNKRLGKQLNGSSAIMNHRWFRVFDWRALATCQIPAPIVPTVSRLSGAISAEKFDEEEIPVSY